MILIVSTANCVTVEPEVTSEISADCRGKVSTSARKSSDYLSKKIAENIKKNKKYSFAGINKSVAPLQGFPH